jgi:hypothetical protein
MSVLEHIDPVMQILPIDNGYLLVISPDTHGGPGPKIIYAKTEVAIAEEIIAAQARHKLDIEPKQGEMFSPEEMDRRKKK